MIIKCWGARGSISVSGKEFLKYGGDTTCIEIRTKSGDIVIVDAGSGIRGLGNRLLKENRPSSNLILTHSHWDHLLGFPFFKPLYHPEALINVFAPRIEGLTVKEMMAGLFASPYFPIAFKNIGAKVACHALGLEPFSIGSLHITPIPLSHPNQGLGYKFTEEGRSFVFLTDNELTFKHPGGLDVQEYASFCAGADLLLHDGEYTEEDYLGTKGWGHSMYKDALGLALESGVKKLGLVHHNQDRRDGKLDEILADCRNVISTQNSDLECHVMRQGMVITLDGEGVTLDEPDMLVEKEVAGMRDLREENRALLEQSQRFEREKERGIQQVIVESSDELAQLKSTITTLREELEKMQAQKESDIQKNKALFSNEIGQLKETIRAQHEKMTVNRIAYEEKIQENRQIMQSEITELKETISVMRKQLETPDGK
jgi:phosphoribosyl 1,2-cyclic phosphodiesterase